MKAIFYFLIFYCATALLYAQGTLLTKEELANAKEYTLKEALKADPLKVYKLNLYGNQLKELPKEIFQLHNLQVLNCSFNQLTTLAGIEKLTNLTELSSGYNQLTTLAGIEKLTKTNLTSLDCRGNQLTTLAGIEKLTNLTWLYCSENKLTTLAVSIRRFKKLQTFDCSGNPLNSTFNLLNKFESLETGKEIRHKIVLANITLQKNQQNYISAISIGEEFRDFYAQENELNNLASILNQLALLYKDQQQPEKAFAYAEKAFKIAQKEKLESLALEAESIMAIIKAEQKTLNAEKIAKEKAELNTKLAEEKRKGEEKARLQAEEDKKRAEKAEAKAKDKEKEANTEKEKAKESEAQAQTQRNIAYVVGIVAVLLGLFALYQMAVARKQRKIADIEKSKSEKLLLNILPEEVATELKEKGITEVRHFDNASILFADVKGFSALASKVTPQELIKELDATFTKMDEISMQYGLERIKTIGDCYMAVAGIPQRNATNPVDIILAALGIQKWMNDEREARGGNFWQVRLGTHTGELVAGVIGKTKFAYDVWGSAVNLASRMESGGEVGKVNTTEHTKNITQDFFEFTFRGELEAKNIGKVNAYFVDRIKPELSSDVEGFVPNEKFWALYKSKFN